MSPSRSRYRPDEAPDYSHRFHAGNVGDVWKHCVLGELLRRVSETTDDVEYVESHAGEGCYDLGPTGEWSEGIGRLWRIDALAAPTFAEDGALGRYLRLCREFADGGERPRRQPGSPLIAARHLGPRARLRLFERDAAAAATLRTRMASDSRAEVTEGDGLVALPHVLSQAEARAREVVCLVDPPYGRKSDWEEVTMALSGFVATTARARFVLWYPVKSLTRPNAMRARLEKEGVAGVMAEVITTSLEHQRQRLNGSGVIVVRPPEGLVATMAAAAAELAARCATRSGEWSTRMVAWPG